MDNLVQAVEALAKKGILDYLLIIVPIIISFLAIIISVCTARKQNKIALFEKRYEALSQIRTMLSFSESIADLEDMTLTFCLFDGYFGTDLYDKSLDEKIVQSIARIEVLKDAILQANFLFGANCNTNLEEIINHLKKFILAIPCDGDYMNYKDSFCKMCAEFYDSDFRKMVKTIALK